MLFNPQIQTKINDLAKRAGGNEKPDGALEQLAELLKEILARVEKLEDQARAAKFAPGGRLRK